MSVFKFARKADESNNSDIRFAEVVQKLDVERRRTRLSELFDSKSVLVVTNFIDFIHLVLIWC